MTKWEYKVETLIRNTVPGTLKQHGLEGWELCAVIPAFGDYITIYMKRAIYERHPVWAY